MAEVGCQGRISQEGLYRSSQIFKKLKENTLNFVPPQELPKKPDSYWANFTDNHPKVPLVYVTDDACPLSKHYIKPYSYKSRTEEECTFDYLLSCNKRISENLKRIYFHE